MLLRSHVVLVIEFTVWGPVLTTFWFRNRLCVHVKWPLSIVRTRLNSKQPRLALAGILCDKLLFTKYKIPSPIFSYAVK